MKANDIQTVAVLGAGTMGAQIAYTCAARGYAVHCVDQSPIALERARGAHGRLAARDFPGEAERAAVRARITYAESLAAGVSGTDLVIEVVPEILELKRKVFAELDTLCPPQVILASSSSAQPVSRFETGVRHCGRVCNMHFSPCFTLAGGLASVEIMGGSQTSELTLVTARRFVESLGLVSVMISKENLGFGTNRVWRAMKRECLRLVANGITTPAEVDRGYMAIWGTVRGPFGVMDLIGLDVVRDIERFYADESGDPADQPPAFLEEMIARGELGAKSGKGFYTYPNPAYLQPDWLPRRTARPDGTTQAAAGERFIGTWRLISFEALSEGQTTYPYGRDLQGLLLYTPSGHVSVVLSKPERARFAVDDLRRGTPEEKATAFDSCLAYFGTFEVGDGEVIHRIEHCTFPNWVGAAQVRFFEFDGDRLTLRTPPLPMGGKETVSRLIWERVEP